MMFSRITSKLLSRLHHEANFQAQTLEVLDREVTDAERHCKPGDHRLRKSIAARRRRLAELRKELAR